MSKGRRSLVQALIGAVVCSIAALLVPATAAAQPERVVSTNVCTDQYLLSLIEVSRIAAVSNLADDPNLSNVVSLARPLRKIGARAEEIVPLQPDLVLANAWTGAKANQFLRGLGIEVVVIPDPRSFTEVAQVLRQLGSALGVEDKARSLIDQMDARLARVKPAGRALRTLIYEPNGYTPSTGTFSDDVLSRAGHVNLAPSLGVANYGTVPLERVVMSAPGLLIFDDHAPSRASRAQALLYHPALKTVARKAQITWIPAKLWLCAGPWSVEAVEQLALFERRS